jgi:hypothetical protein
VPSVDEYLDASNREGVRVPHKLTKRLEKYGFDGEHLFVEANWQMLAEVTPERREKDRETVEACIGRREGTGRWRQKELGKNCLRSSKLAAQHGSRGREYIAALDGSAGEAALHARLRDEGERLRRGSGESLLCAGPDPWLVLIRGTIS